MMYLETISAINYSVYAMRTIIVFAGLLVISQSNTLGKPRVTDLEEDADLLVPELVQKYGYPCERHTVTSSDGYILEMHRIPFGKEGPSENRPALMLLHGLLSSSADWIITGPKNGLGYILADEGYDVWIANVRGNRYSRKHVSLDPDKDADEFWNFSWHEIALYDLPASVDYIINQTGQEKIYHIGHSQGTTTFYVLCSEKPEYNDKFKVHISLAPVGYMNNMQSPLLRFIALFEDPIDKLFQLIGINEFLPNTELLNIMGETLCPDESPFQFLCSNTLFVIAGFNPAQMNETLLPTLMGHTPAGASTKQIVHYGQEVNSARFRQFDYGFFGNVIRYGQFSPPNYNLDNIKTPMYMFYSRNDWLSSEKDALKLYNQISSVQGKFLVMDKLFTHFDYLFGIDAPNVVYNRLVSLLKRH